MCSVYHWFYIPDVLVISNKYTVWVAIDSFFIWIVHVDMWHAGMDPILQFLPIGHEIGWCVYFFGSKILWHSDMAMTIKFQD